MPYVTDRRVLDADAHIMEPPDWLASYVDADVAAELPAMDGGDDEFAALLAASASQHALRSSDADEAEQARAEIMSMPRKGWMALGGSDPHERRVALDELGFELQIVFPTASFPQVAAAPAHIQLDAAIGMNRGIADMCSADPRLVPTAYIPLHQGVDEALRTLDDAIARSIPVAMVDMIPARGAHGISHPDHDRIWAAIVDADMVLSVHVGLDNGWRPVRPETFDNGRTLAHFRSDAPGDAVSYMAIGFPAQLFLSALVFDGVLARFPRLRILVAELGAAWVPGFLQQLDQSFRAFRRMQDLSHLDEPPSEAIARQVRFTPFAGEPVGWMMGASSPSLYVFSSDFPHHEGSDDPIRRFDATLTDRSAAERDLFYAENLASLLGRRVDSGQ